MFRPTSEPPDGGGQQTMGVVMLAVSSSGVVPSALALRAFAFGGCVRCAVRLPLAFVFVAPLLGAEGPPEKNMRTTKMNAMSGSATAAIILLRSAGGFT